MLGYMCGVVIIDCNRCLLFMCEILAAGLHMTITLAKSSLNYNVIRIEQRTRVVWRAFSMQSGVLPCVRNILPLATILNESMLFFTCLHASLPES